MLSKNTQTSSPAPCLSYQNAARRVDVMHTSREKDGKAQYASGSSIKAALNAKQCNYYKEIGSCATFIPQNKDNTTLYCRIIPEEFRNKNAMCYFALAASVFKTGDVNVLPVKLQLCPQCVQDLGIQHLTSQYTPVHPNPREDKYSRNSDNCSRTKEQLGCHEHTWETPQHP